jgi:hypothetical protein
MKTWTGNLWGWLSLAAVISLNVCITAAAATTHYVDVNGTNPVPPYTDWSTAATNIQDALDYAGSGDTVLVTNGLYQYGCSGSNGETNRIVVNTNISVQSVNGPAVTIIKGYQVPGTTNGSTAIRCVYLSLASTLYGFTLTNGATISGETGGGVYCEPKSTVDHCIICGNAADNFGGGANNVGGTLKNCIIFGNTATYGGGVGTSSFGGAVNNCLIFSNTATIFGGGGYNCNYTNCTIVANKAYNKGGGVYGGSSWGILRNSIIYFNTGGTLPNLLGVSSFDYCCTTIGGGPTLSNITNQPAFVNLAGGDYHLSPASPCINAGNNSFITVSNDLDGNPRIVNGRVDIGAYESPYNEGVHYVDAAGTNPVSPFNGWSIAATNIQDAIDASSDGDLVLVTNGVYATGGRVVYGSLTNRVVIDKAVTVQSINGPGATIIRGYQIPSSSAAYSSDVRCVYMKNNVVLDGFTITGGAALSVFGGGTINFARTQLAGGGVFCETTNSMLTNCILTGNTCVSTDSQAGGGAIYQGTLDNCILSNNLVPGYGVPGGAAYQSLLINCLITSNSASFGGGAAFSILNHCSVIANIAPFYGSTSWGGGTYMCTANYCVISGNLSTSSGGGDCQGILNGCILSNNMCILPVTGGKGSGGGSYQQPPNGSYVPMLNNCLIISNYCYGDGGGVYVVPNGAWPVLANCTIVGNTATNEGGGVWSGVLKNSIIYGNYCTSAAYGFSSNIYNAKLTNCWTSDPVYVNESGENFYLSSNSPCINSGNNAFVTSSTDLDGNPRISGGTVDIGAYEYQNPASVLSYAWAQQYGLPTDGSADYADSDGTGMSNWQKWIAGLDPTNPASVLAMQSPSATNNAGGITVTWQSVNTRTYYLQRATDLTAQPPFSAIQSNLVGQAGTTSYTDTTATNAGPYFYRVGVQ